ncbi:MAG TPA: LysM peptidoglycan-binding domain-containing protein [Verrucomicrobiales bacterium]|nr:LysM peptidoglycan-binding domain-containing protein [Verrucomicrobiales bacterium]
MPLPEQPAPPPKTADSPAPEAKPSAPAEPRPATWEVKKGDALIRIAQKFAMTPAQLKQFNGLKNDRIVIGQTLRIPTPEELLAMEPPPPPPEPKPKAAKGKGKRKDAGNSAETPGESKPKLLTFEQRELEIITVQVFLDREMFSAGGIDGKAGPAFQEISQLYQQSHPEVAEEGQLTAKALAEVKQPYASYYLRAEDFKFIKPREVAPKADSGGKPSPAVKKSGKKGGKSGKTPPTPPVTIDQLVAAEFLGYTSAWEFVAERFHCDEAFLRRLNPKPGEKPAVGAVFQVPNVIPFEIEKALDPPLQPAADPQKPVTAAVENSLLKISREKQLIAVMPLASARPGLRGRGSWTVLDAIPKPRLTTKREPREAPKTPPAPADGTPPAVAPPLESPQFLGPGPNNPAGILWIHLAKAKSTEPLPYGLHGTSIPAKMKSLEGIGGLRLTNWDIARAVRLMPAGTALHWIP